MYNKLFFMKSNKQYKHGDKITIHISEDENGQGIGESIDFIYNAPSTDDAFALHNLFTQFITEYASEKDIDLKTISKHESEMSDSEKAMAQKCMLGAYLKMNTNKEARELFKVCLAKCVVNANLFPMAIQLPENEPFYGKIRMLILDICNKRFEAFTPPHNGK